MKTPKTSLKTIFLVLIILIVPTGLLTYVLLKKHKQNNEDEKINDKINQTVSELEQGGSNAAFPLVYNPNLKSPLVLEMQKRLNTRLKDWKSPLTFPTRDDGTRIESLKEDGYFGKETLAVVKFQWPGKTQVTEEMFNQL